MKKAIRKDGLFHWREPGFSFRPGEGQEVFFTNENTYNIHIYVNNLLKVFYTLFFKHMELFV